jgi:dTDP-4-amino-4,6-dideoxygalactose transaminase
MADINWWSTYLGEEETAAVLAAMAGKRFSQGPVTAELEREIAARLQVRHAVMTTSGSMGLLMALMALDVGKGDEVIVPDVTWIATAHAPVLLGARVVLCECCVDRPLMDVERLGALITARTKAIIPVHLNGRAVDMPALLALARSRGIAVLEDAAQALASRSDGRHLGTFGDAGVYSLSLTKLVSTGQGGAVVTDDDALHARLLSVRGHGVADYGGEERYLALGGNFKFNDVLAAIGRAQLARLADKVAHVTDVYRRYRDGLNGLDAVRLIPVDVESGEVPLWTEVLCRDRPAVMAHLKARGVGTRPYHPALHTAPHLPHDVDHPRAWRFATGGLVLPSGPSQPREAVDRTIAALRELG